jgi:hypothetical protein
VPTDPFLLDVAGPVLTRGNLQANGNVGIGTAAPVPGSPIKLDMLGGYLRLQSNQANLTPDSVGAAGGFAVSGNRSNGQGEIDFFNLWELAQESFRFSQKVVGSTVADLMSITRTSGEARVGIGTTTPAAPLHVVGNAEVHGGVNVNGSASAGITVFDGPISTTNSSGQHNNPEIVSVGGFRAGTKLVADSNGCYYG